VQSDPGERNPSLAEHQALIDSVTSGRVADVMSTLRQGMDADNATPEQFYAAGERMAQAWRFEGAQWAFENAVSGFDAREADSPLSQNALMRRGIARVWLGHSAEGLADLERAVPGGGPEVCDMLSPARPRHVPVDDATRDWALSLHSGHDCAAAIGFVAESYGHTDEPERAVAFLRDFLEERPDEMRWLRIMADIRRNAGEYREAVEVLHHLCELGTCDSGIRGEIVWNQSYYRDEPGVLDAQVALADAAPDDLLLQFEAGVMLHYRRHYDRSSVYLGRARERWPHDPRILLYMAMNSYRGGHLERSREEIDYAREHSDSDDADLYYCSAVIYRNIDLAFAIEMLERYMTIAVHVPEEKSEMTEVFLGLMQEEAQRRAEGQPPRPFADPEEHHFGEPSDSPGLAPNAIHVMPNLARFRDRR